MTATRAAPARLVRVRPHAMEHYGCKGIRHNFLGEILRS